MSEANMRNQTFNIPGYSKLLIVFSLIFIAMLKIKADTVPYPWFDEGWTLTTARNWLEHGKYALRLDHEWVSGETMTQPFTVTAPIALSFRLFGFGFVAGRLPNILYTIGIFATMYLIARQLYGNRVAWATLLIMLTLPIASEFQLLITGRQALGEVPMLFFLLAGYWLLFRALQHPRKIFTLLAISLFWGLALVTKRQPLPFWLLSVLLPLALSLKNKDYQTSKVFIVCLVGSGILAALFMKIENNLLASAPLYGPRVSPEYLRLLVWDSDPVVRWIAIQKFMIIGIFPSIAIIYYIKGNIGIFTSTAPLSPNAWVELSLWTVLCSWTAWFLLGSWGWLRYYMPAYIVSWLFFTKAVSDWTSGLDFKKSLKKLVAASTAWKKYFQLVAAIGLLAISITIMSSNLSWFISMALSQPDGSLYSLIDYIRANTTPTTVIETYDSELLFMLPDRLIHFPSHQIEEELNRRVFLKENIALTYDPLAANPDILIIGDYGRAWHIYDTLLAERKFIVLTHIGRYDVYQRVR